MDLRNQFATRWLARCLGSCLGSCLGIALFATALFFGTAPATASPDETPPETQALHEELERFADTLKAHSDRAIRAAAQAAHRAVEENRDTIADLESQWTEQLETFRGVLNDQKANLDIMSEDAAAKLDAWTQAAKEQWDEMHQSALEALDLLQEWLDRQSASEEPIPV